VGKADLTWRRHRSTANQSCVTEGVKVCGH
jgi:hypothetical protein